jgi:hypothetical protein
MEELTGQNQIKFNELVVHKSIKNNQHRTECIEAIRNRAQTAKHPSFKNN